MRAAVQRIWDDNEQVYRAEKGVATAASRRRPRGALQVERLMRQMGLRGAVRGRAWIVTTRTDDTAARPADLADRQIVATRLNQLWWRLHLRRLRGRRLRGSKA